MLIISYDIEDDKLRTRFSKMITKNGAVRLQYSVYEFNNTKRHIENITVKIEEQFKKHFSGGDSIMIFDVKEQSVKKYGCAIHRDKDINYF